ncbi:MAG: CorA family divalent cation transporter [bacterium]|nr:CorA family divalent cation transporter [bacterium]
MIFRYEYPGGIWVDLEQPTSDEIQRVAREFSISERIEAELLSPTPSSLVAGDEGTALLILHFPTPSSEGIGSKNQEIDFIIGRNFVVTVRYEVVVPLHNLKKLLETQKIVDHRSTIATDVLLEILFAHLYTAVRDHTDHAAVDLARVERDMFDGRERNTVREISNVSREFLHLESALVNQEESLGHFLKMLAERDFFGASFAGRAQRIETERVQVVRLIKTHRAIATELRETNLALLGARQNEIMKTLTVITFIFLPLELITFVFSMHAPGTPLEQNPNAFWIITSSMLIIGALITIFVAKKRWL